MRPCNLLWGPLILIQRPFRSHGLLEFVVAGIVSCLHGGGLDTNSVKSWNIIHILSCKISCRLFIHDNFFLDLWFSPSSLKVNLDNHNLFDLDLKDLKNAMVTGLSSRVWSGPKLHLLFLQSFCPNSERPYKGKQSSWSQVCKVKLRLRYVYPKPPSNANQHYVPHAYIWKHLMYACGT